ncbi:MAG: TRAP transporter substrate-binding protein [Proteobacteria bacterium]|nr:TRAP transporter substrate-binding protein [Burkholderiales bacterium]
MSTTITGRQFHNQPEKSHTHGFLVDLWDEVRRETHGRMDIAVFAQNAGIEGSDPQALEMLISGELEFIILMGGILGHVVPATEMQGVPFAFSSHAQVHATNDGPFGAYLRREMLAHGIYGFPGGLMENGFRHIVMNDRPINDVRDLEGVRMRVPDGHLFIDTFAALGATPVVVNISALYDSLAQKKVDGQENPLSVCEVNKLYEVCKYVSITNHMWSGFNLVGNLGFVQGLPEDVLSIVQRAVKTHVARQTAWTDRFNHDLEKGLAERGMIFNVADNASFRRALTGDFYRRAKERYGNTGWKLLEDSVGKLG